MPNSTTAAELPDGVIPVNHNGARRYRSERRVRMAGGFRSFYGPWRDTVSECLADLGRRPRVKRPTRDRSRLFHLCAPV